MNIDGVDLSGIFQLVPQLKPLSLVDFSIEKISGYTNNNFRLKNQQHDWILRVPKKETNSLINRDNEAFNIDIAVKLQLAPESLWRNSSGLSLTPTCMGAREFKPMDMRTPKLCEYLLQSIYQLHSSENKFLGLQCLPTLLAEYMALISPELNKKLWPLTQKAFNLYSKIENHDNRLVPSHNDLVLENILITEPQGIRIIDWEYSTMASPYWDLATLCNTAKLDKQQSQQLQALYGSNGANLNLEILMVYRFMLLLLSICWMALFSRQDMQLDLDYLNQFEL